MKRLSELIAGDWGLIQVRGRRLWLCLALNDRGRRLATDPGSDKKLSITDVAATFLVVSENLKKLEEQ